MVAAGSDFGFDGVTALAGMKFTLKVAGCAGSLRS